MPSLKRSEKMSLFNPYDDFSEDDPIWKKFVGFLADSLLSLVAPISLIGLLLSFFGGIKGGNPFLQVCGWIGVTSIVCASAGLTIWLLLWFIRFRYEEELPIWLQRSIRVIFLLFLTSSISGILAVGYFVVGLTNILH